MRRTYFMQAQSTLARLSFSAFFFSCGIWVFKGLKAIPPKPYNAADHILQMMAPMEMVRPLPKRRRKRRTRNGMVMKGSSPQLFKMKLRRQISWTIHLQPPHRLRKARKRRRNLSSEKLLQRSGSFIYQN